MIEELKELKDHGFIKWRSRDRIWENFILCEKSQNGETDKSPFGSRVEHTSVHGNEVHDGQWWTHVWKMHLVAILKDLKTRSISEFICQMHLGFFSFFLFFFSSKMSILERKQDHSCKV